MPPLVAIGVPIDSVGRSGGTELAPAAVRERGLLERLDARDRGDLDVRIRGDMRDPETGIVGAADVLTVTRAVRDAVREAVTDVDVLDQAAMPPTDYLMPGGLEYDELAELLAPLCAAPGLAGISLACLNPEKDPDGCCTERTCDLLANALGA